MLQQSDSVDITTKIPATAAVSHSSRLTFCNHFFFFTGEVIVIASFFNLKGTDRDSKINLSVEILNVTVPAITHRWKQSAYIHSVQSTKLNFIYIALYTHTMSDHLFNYCYQTICGPYFASTGESESHHSDTDD